MNAHLGSALRVEPYSGYDEVRALVVQHWGEDALVIAGKAHRTDEMMLKAVINSADQLGGVAIYRMNGATVLLGAIIVVEGHHGIGTVLFQSVVSDARELKLKKLRASTTNDNVEAMKFYQKRGMRLNALFAGGADAFRAFRPGLHVMGRHGIPCRDIIELEMDL